MLTRGQARELSKKLKTNESVVYREFLQLYLLNGLYSLTGSERVFFKGGTALHLIYKTPRFSEDLDFTVGFSENKFKDLIREVFLQSEKGIQISFKEKKTITGKSYLATAEFPNLSYEVFVKLDFSFREVCKDPQKSIVETSFPILFKSYVYHLSEREIFAEKVRAILTRRKGRDIYDLWFLLNREVRFDDKLVKDKLSYYKIKGDYRGKLIEKVNSFSKEEFVLDLLPFVPIDARPELPKFLEFVKAYISNKFKK